MSFRAQGQFHAGLDVQQRAASTALPTTPTQLILPTVVSSVGGIMYNTGTGIYTSPAAGVYDTVIQFNVSAAAARTFYFYIENDLGGGYVINRYSARQINLNAATDGQITIASSNYFPAGVGFKFYFWVTGGAANIVTIDVPGTTPGTVTVPAARVMITGA